MASFYASLRRQRKEAFLCCKRMQDKGVTGADTEAAACPVSDVQRYVFHLDISG